MEKISPDGAAGKKIMNGIMVGLDNSGKTVILYNLKLGEVVTSIPTIGFNVESIEYKNIELTIYDIGGQDKIRTLWKHYYSEKHFVIYVIDASNLVNIRESIDFLVPLTHEPEFKDAVFLIFANKQDLPNCIPIAHLRSMINDATNFDTRIHIEPCCAFNISDLHRGLDWIVENSKFGYRTLVPKDVEYGKDKEIHKQEQLLEKLLAIRDLVKILGKENDPLTQNLNKVLTINPMKQIEVDSHGFVSEKNP